MTEETIFTMALDKQTPAERSAFLDEVCAGNVALRQRVEGLIEAHAQAADFLEKPAVEQIAAGISSPRSHPEAILAATEGITRTPADVRLGPTQAERSSGGEDEPSLDFLASSEKPGALGRIGHYDVLAVIGRGGFGVVLKAFDEELQRVVAIKVMAPQLAATGNARKRFRREAQAAAAVRDEHVIDIHAVEEVNGLPYLVMEYVSGISLQDRLDQSGPLELKEILRIGMQTATGLAKAHAQGLIHRDIKPANILLENGVQRVKITDFGLARAVDDASLTQSGVIAGTPQYMAPEQARGETVDHRADLFSLGSLLYAMCTGHPPFRASSAMAVLKRVCDETPRPIREINPEIPDWLCAIIEKLQAKEPAQRFQSASEVAELLGQHLSHLQQPSVVPMPPEVVVRRPRASRKRSRAAVWVLVAVGVLMLGFCVFPVVGLLVFGYRTVSEEESAPESQVDEVLAPAPVGGWELENGDTPRQIRQSRTILLGNPCRTPAVAFSPDKKTLATADDRGFIFLWDARSGNKIPMFQFQAHSTTIWSLAFSHDGKLLASGCWDGTAKIWDVATHQLRANLPRRKDRIWCVAFSPDNKLLAAASGEHGVLLWDVDHNEMRGSLDRPTCPISVAFSPKNGLLAAGDSLGGARLWDAASGQVRGDLIGHVGQVRLAFSPDGKTLATAGHDKAVILWDVDTRQKEFRLDGFQQMIESVAFSSDGRLLATGGGNWRDPKVSGEVTLWDVVKRKKLAQFVGHAGCVHTVAFSPDGKTLATASHDETVRLWDVPGSDPTSLSLPGHTSMVWCVAWTPDGQMLASASMDQTVRIWRREGGSWQLGQVLEAHQGGARSAAFSRNGRILATCGHDGTVKLWHWDGIRWHKGRILRGHKHSVHSVAFAPNGRLASGGGTWPQKAPGEVKVWNIGTGEVLASFAGHEVHVNALTFSPDGKLLATGSADRTVKLWDTATWKPVATLEVAEVDSVAFSPDGNLLAAGTGDHTITLWKRDGDRWQKYMRLLGHTDEVWPVAFHPDGKVLASGAADKTVRLWDVATGKELATLPGHTEWVRALAFAPDGKTLATGAHDSMVKLWDISRWVSPSRVQVPALKPFVILGHGKADRDFATLDEVVAGAQAGDIIEVRGDGPFVSPPIIARKALTIRAGKGFRPVIELSPAQAEGGVPLLETSAPLILEGLQLRRIGKERHQAGAIPKLVLARNAELRAANCRFVAFPDCVAIWANWSPLCELRNCEFLGDGQFSSIDHFLPHSGRLILENNVMLGSDFGAAFHYAQADLADAAVELTHNTMVVRTSIGIFLNTPPAPFALGAGATNKPIRLKASGNLLDGQIIMELFQSEDFLSRAEPLDVNKAQSLLGRLIAWNEQNNVYSNTSSLLTTYVKFPEMLPAGNSLERWNRFWGVKDTTSVLSLIRYRGGDLRSRALRKLEQVTPEDFRLQAGSPGNGMGKNGRDLGADVDLVGPGAAYERWKKTPAYEEWRKRAGQFKEDGK